MDLVRNGRVRKIDEAETWVVVSPSDVDKSANTQWTWPASHARAIISLWLETPDLLH